MLLPTFCSQALLVIIRTNLVEDDERLAAAYICHRDVIYPEIRISDAYSRGQLLLSNKFVIGNLRIVQSFDLAPPLIDMLPRWLLYLASGLIPSDFQSNEGTLTLVLMRKMKRGNSRH